MNNVNVFGRLANDGSYTVSGGGMGVYRFSVAVDRYHADGENETDFIPCIAFGKTADFLKEYAKKGQQIAVNGSLKSGSYEKEGQKHYTLDVFVDRAELGREPLDKPEEEQPKKAYSKYHR